MRTKFFSVLMVLAFFATFTGCGTSAHLLKVEGLPEDAPKIIAIERTKPFGHDYAGVVVLQKRPVQTQQVSTPPTLMTSTARKCSEEKVRDLHRQLEKNRLALLKCKDFSLNNLELRLERETILRELGECTCDARFFREAIKNLETAAGNYRFGKDIKKHKAEADRLITQVYKDWEELKRRDLASCSVEVKSVVEIPSSAPVQITQQEQGYDALYFGGNPSTGNLAIPAGMIGAGMALQQPARAVTNNVNKNNMKQRQGQETTATGGNATATSDNSQKIGIEIND